MAEEFASSQPSSTTDFGAAPVPHLLDTGSEYPPPGVSLSAAQAPLVTLTELIQVPVTSVWPTEAHHFTPWLLRSSELLSKLLNIDVELESREYKVGNFWLDIIGQEVATGGVVIIENQFGATDHGHLGQILTYAGGTKPTVVVWVAETFREEHRAALEWLNSHTDPAIRFFGVKLAAVTLAGAPAGLIAPALELVVKPNDWEKQAVAATSVAAADTSPIQELYRQFWTRFGEFAKQRGWTHATPPAHNWWDLPSGSAGVTWGVSYSNFGCRSELYFGGPDPAVNLARWQVLNEQREEISSSFGEPLHFDELPEKKACRIEARLEGPKIVDQQGWDGVIAWMLEPQARLRDAVQSAGGIPTAIQES